MAAYREARALDILLPGIFARLAEAGISGGVLVVNDLGAHDEEMSCCCRRHGAQMIDAPHNLGSQEAIMHGLRQLPEGDLPDLVITMDSDGQDDISALPLLIRESLKNPDSIVVAQRVGNRPEGVRFSIGYEIYKLGFWLLTGIRPDFGNYAAYGGRTAGRIARNPMLGPAYSMALPLVAPLIRLPVCRLPRLHGQARVGWSGLFEHALKSTLPHLSKISLRVCAASVLLGLAFLIATLLVVGMKLLFPGHTFPNWVTQVVSFAVLFSMEMLTISIILFLASCISRQISSMPGREGNTSVHGRAGDS